MAIDYQKLKSWPFQEIVQPYTAKDCILYALGLGLGADPLDRNQLRFVYEDNLQMLPTMPVVLASPGFWLRDPGTGVEWKTVLHGEQGLTIHRPLPAAATVVGTTRIEEIIDKGPGKGALIYTRRELRDQHSGELLCSLSSTSFCRSEGGFGGPSGPTRAPHELPARGLRPVVRSADSAAGGTDLPLERRLQPVARRSGGAAAAAGFRQPILHGLCTYGVAGHALLKTLCGYDATRLRRMDVRFSAPVYPGETIRTEIWHEGRGRAQLPRARRRARYRRAEQRSGRIFRVSAGRSTAEPQRPYRKHRESDPRSVRVLTGDPRRALCDASLRALWQGLPATIHGEAHGTTRRKSGDRDRLRPRHRPADRAAAGARRRGRGGQRPRRRAGASRRWR